MGWMSKGVAAVSVIAASHAHAALTYSIHTSEVGLSGINNAGVMVGANGDKAVVIDGNLRTELNGPAGAIGSGGTDISDNGTIVGYYWTSEETDPSSGTVSLGPLGSFIYTASGYTVFNVPGSTQTIAYGISPDGRFVSGRFFTDDDRMGAFVYDTTGAVPLQAFGVGTRFPRAQGINANGVAVGALGSVGYTLDLQTGAETTYSFDGYQKTGFRDITADGRIGGFVETSELVDADYGQYRQHGFFGTPDNYQLIDVPGAIQTVVSGVNDKGELVGFYLNADWTTGGFTAIPVPEPATWCLSIAGLLAVGLAGRRRA